MNKHYLLVKSKKYQFIATGRVMWLLLYLSEQDTPLQLDNFIQDTSLACVCRKTAQRILDKAVNTGAVLKVGEGAEATYRLSPKVVQLEKVESIQFFH